LDEVSRTQRPNLKVPGVWPVADGMMVPLTVWETQVPAGAVKGISS